MIDPMPTGTVKRPPADLRRPRGREALSAHPPTPVDDTPRGSLERRAENTSAPATFLPHNTSANEEASPLHFEQLEEAPEAWAPHPRVQPVRQEVLEPQHQRPPILAHRPQTDDHQRKPAGVPEPSGEGDVGHDALEPGQGTGHRRRAAPNPVDLPQRAAARTNHPRQVVEAALAHVLQNKVETGYVLSDLFQHRCPLLDDSIPYLRGPRGLTAPAIDW